MHSAVPFHLFVRCQIPQSHFPCCSQAALTRRFTALASGLFPFRSRGERGERGHLSDRHGNTAFRDSISDAQTEAIYHQLPTVACSRPSSVRASPSDPWLSPGHCDPCVLLTWLRLYQKPSSRMKTALLFGLGERTRLGSVFG